MGRLQIRGSTHVPLIMMARRIRHLKLASLTQTVSHATCAPVMGIISQHALKWPVKNQKQVSCSMTKPTKWQVCPAKIQISLGIRPVWSVFAVCLKQPWVLSYPLSAQRRLWSDWADAQADLSLCWVHLSFYWFCHAMAQQVRMSHLMRKGTLA